MLADLSGKTALVTGGAQGLGLGIARKLAEQGADVAIADMKEEEADNAAKEIHSMGRKSCRFYLDVTDQSSIKQVAAEMADKVGPVDILINNAGVSGASGATGMGFRDVDWEFTWRVNVKGLADMTEAILPQMRERHYGKIINISSVAARNARYLTAYYATTKMAVIAYTQALAKEVAQDNINVNAIAPGRIWTAFHQDWMANRQKQGDLAVSSKDTYSVFETAARETIPMGRPQTPEDIGALAAFLVSEDARNITGQTIQCDGGQVMA